MPLTREDVLSLLDWLKKDPELLAELRRLVLPPNFEGWMARVDERLGHMEDDIATLKADVATLKEDVAMLKADVATLKEDVAMLKTDVAMLKTDVAMLKTDVAALKTDVGVLKGKVKEGEYRDKALIFFSQLLRQGRDGQAEVGERLAEAQSVGKILPKEAEDILRADLFWMGEIRKGKFAGQTVVVIGEISWKVEGYDVERALRRANYARQAGIWVLPFVSGEEWSSDELKRQAVGRNLLCGEDGIFEPSPITDWQAVEALIDFWQPQ